VLRLKTFDYQVITGLSVLGIAAIAYLTGSKASGDFEIWSSVEMNKSQIRLSGELEKTKAEVSREIADAYRKNQIGSFNQIEITDYVYSSTPPNLDWNHNIDPNTLTIVLDQQDLRKFPFEPPAVGAYGYHWCQLKEILPQISWV
jgi:hypothetical protein